MKEHAIIGRFLEITKINLKIIGELWFPFLEEEKRTCQIDIPIDGSGEHNVVMAKAADSLDSCKGWFTSYVAQNKETRFLFWSFNTNPLDKPGYSNCYLFKSCNPEKWTSLRHPGNTYEIFKGIKRNWKYSLVYMFPNIISLAIPFFF